MHECAADIEIVMAAMKKPRGEAVDYSADGGDRHNGIGSGRFRRIQPLDGLPGDAADGDHKDQGIGQRRKDGRALQPVGEALGRAALGQQCRAPGHAEAENITCVMPGVSQERQGIGGYTVNNLGYDEGAVEQDADDKRVAVRSVVVPVMIMGMVVRVGVHEISHSK